MSPSRVPSLVALLVPLLVLSNSVLLPATGDALPPVARPSSADRDMHVGVVGIGLPVVGGNDGPGILAVIGVFVTPRLLVEFAGTASIFGESLISMGAEMHFGGAGAQPRHAFTVGAHVMVNPDLPFGKWNDPGLFGARSGWGGDVLLGWRFIAHNGFFFRLQAGMRLLTGRFTTQPEPVIAVATAGWAL